MSIHFVYIWAYILHVAHCLSPQLLDVAHFLDSIKLCWTLKIGIYYVLVGVEGINNLFPTIMVLFYTNINTKASDCTLYSSRNLN